MRPKVQGIFVMFLDLALVSIKQKLLDGALVFFFVSIEKIYQTLETVFHRLSKHLEFHQKYSAARRIFIFHLGVWISRWNTVSCLNLYNIYW